MAEISDLVAEQEELQFKGRFNKGVKTIRGRGLFGYSMEFEVHGSDPTVYQQVHGFEDLLKLLVEKSKTLVWVDLGCGNGIALREAKVFLEEKGIDPEKLRTYGYDLLSVEENERPSWSHRHQEKILEDRYKPVIIKEDITTAVFPEKPDLITANNVLFWTRDPLAVFANAASQLKLDGHFCLNNLHSLNDFSDPSRPLGRKLFPSILKQTAGILPGLDVLALTVHSALLRKSADKDFTFGYKLVHRLPAHQGSGFEYFYSR